MHTVIKNGRIITGDSILEGYNLCFEDGRITAYPIKELQYLLRDEDPCLVRTETGFYVERTNREPLVYEGEIINSCASVTGPRNIPTGFIVLQEGNNG